MTLFLDFLKPSILSVALSLVLLTSCASKAPMPEQWLGDKDLVLQSLQDAHINNAKLQEKLEALDQRILDLERIESEQETKILMLQASAAKNKIKQKPAPKSNRNTLQKNKQLTQRLDAMSEKIVPSQVGVKSSTDVEAQSAEKNAYTAAYLALKSGRYDEASSGFVAVIQKHPKGQYTDQAYYWLGESLVALHRNKEALESFTVVVSKYPDSPKHAAALLKVAMLYQGMSQFGDAKAALERVIKEYPDSRAAERARTQLNSLLQAHGAKP